MTKFSKIIFLTASLSVVVLPARADKNLLEALEAAGVPMTEQIAAQVEAAQGNTIADAVAAVVAGLGTDGVRIEQAITATVTATPEYAVDIVSASIAVVPSAAAIIAGAAVGAAPEQAAAIVGAAVSLVPTNAEAITASATAAAPDQSALIMVVAQTALPGGLPGTGETTPPSPN